MNIPREVLDISKKLKEAGFEAYLVGGCVRDILINREPKDWDLTTNAIPEEIQKVFPDHFFENDFGTVSVITKSEEESLKVIEITPYRLEGKYSDKRHPDEISFSDNLKDDLSRRDFTVNSLAMDAETEEIVDLFSGKEDLEKKLIRAVGDPKKRFEEDALRMLRAVRLVVRLDFLLEKETAEAIIQMSSNLKDISAERVRDEFVKIVMSSDAERGIRLLTKLGLLKYILPDILEGIDVIGVTKHKKGHIKYDQLSVFEHSLLTMAYAVKSNFNLETRLASLLHDVAKPRTKKGEGLKATFRAHEIIGARMAKKALENLRFSREVIDKVYTLVRWHFFFYNTDEVSEAGVRRLISRVGKDNMEDLLRLREADRSGSGLPKISPYRLKHLRYMIEKVSKDPIEPKMLSLRGEDLMNLLDIKSGPKVGWILNSLLEEVLDDPSKNTKEYLESRAKELGNLSDEDLKKMFLKAKSKKEEVEEEIDREMRERNQV